MKVLVTANFTEDGLKRLKALGLEAIYEPWGERGKLLLSDELAERLMAAGAEAVILEVDLCHEEVFESCSLRFVGCCRGDPLNVDVDEATAKGVPVFFTPGRNADAVADMALGFMLCHLRQIISIHNLLVSGRFDPQTPEEFMRLFQEMTGFELGGKVVGIVGLGAVGGAVAKRVRAFGAAMLGHDPFAPDERFLELGVTRAPLEDIFRNSDIVTLHAAVTDQTEGMITRALIESMKPEAFFVNLARAELVDEDALYQALAEKKIAGAGIDVYMSEPPKKEERFLHLDNVIVTPHIGGATRDVVRHQTDTVLADVEAFLQGKKPKYCANPQVLEKKA